MDLKFNAPEKHFVREKLKKERIQTKDVLADLDSADLFNATLLLWKMEKIKNLTEYAMKNLKMFQLQDIIMLTSPDIIMQNLRNISSNMSDISHFVLYLVTPTEWPRRKNENMLYILNASVQDPDSTRKLEEEK